MSDTPLSALADAFYRRQWDRFPTMGSTVGLYEYDSRLEAPDAALIRAEVDDCRATLNRLEEIPAPGAGAAAGDILDRREFEAQLKLRLHHLENVNLWKTNPAQPVDELVSCLFYLVMRRDVSDPATAEAVAARLEAAPAYLDALRSRITDPCAVWMDLAAETAESGGAFLDELVRGVAERHPALKPRLAAGADAAGKALAGYAAWIGERKGTPLNPDPAIGAENLTGIVRLNHGLSDSLEEIAAFGRKQIEELKARQGELAKRIDPDLSPGDIIRRAGRRYAESDPDVLAEYKALTTEIRDRLVSEGVLELPPGETCSVISCPDFLRPVMPTAAYSNPGALDRNQLGIFYVSDPPKSMEREDYLANVAMHFPLAPTCAHEAYPGHHLQLCWANRAPSLIRKLSDHIIFMEGWTLYCEQLMVELGWYAEPVFELAYLNDQLWRACRVVIDAGVQSGAMSVDDAVAMLRTEVGFTPQRAQTELNWYTQSPGTPMSYLLGKGKTLELRERYRTAHAGSSLKDFHGWLLSHGSIPQTWLLDVM